MEKDIQDYPERSGLGTEQCQDAKPLIQGTPTVSFNSTFRTSSPAMEGDLVPETKKWTSLEFITQWKEEIPLAILQGMSVHQTHQT